MIYFVYLFIIFCFVFINDWEHTLFVSDKIPKYKEEKKVTTHELKKENWQHISDTVGTKLYN